MAYLGHLTDGPLEKWWDGEWGVGILRDATIFFFILGHTFFWPESVGIYFLLTISWGNFRLWNFNHPTPPPPPHHFSNGLLPCHVLLHAILVTTGVNVKLNDTEVCKKMAFEKLLKYHFSIAIKSMILLIFLTAVCWKYSALKQQYSVTIVRLAGH